MADPLDELIDPKVADPIPDKLENVLGASQYISPSYWLGEAMNLVIGTNPFQWAAEQFTGDWQAVQVAGKAVQNLAAFNEVFASRINSGVAAVGYGWEGNARDAADDYFGGVVQALRGNIGVLVELGWQLDTTAFSVYETAGALKGMLEGLVDLLIAIGVEMAASGASAATVVGPIIGGASIAVTSGLAVAKWEEIMAMTSNLFNALQAFAGLVSGLLGELNDNSLPLLPAREYDHPAVRPPAEPPVSHHRE